MSFKIISILILLSITITMTFSCNSYKYGANSEPTEKSNLTFGMVKSKVVKNKTTQEEIIKLFGAPNMITKSKSNNEVWSYNKMNTSDKNGNTDFLFGRKASQTSSSQSFDLIITFDDNDVVVDYSVITTSY